MQAQYGYAARPAYAGFWIRLLAVIIDSLIVAVPIIIVAVILGIVLGVALGASGNTSSQTVTSASNGLQVLIQLISLVIGFAYFVYFWGTGSTLGMRLFRLRVVDANTGATIGLGRAALRYVGFIISAIPCYIGLIWAAFDSRKQGWHDKIATTVVLQG